MRKRETISLTQNKTGENFVGVSKFVHVKEFSSAMIENIQCLKQNQGASGAP